MSKSATFTNDAGKVITEISGLSTTGTSEVSVARITVPRGITNTPERNDFVEMVLPTEGEGVAEVDGKEHLLRLGGVPHGAARRHVRRLQQDQRRLQILVGVRSGVPPRSLPRRTGVATSLVTPSLSKGLRSTPSLVEQTASLPWPYLS